MTAADLAVGSEVVVDIGPVAHGGHCIARHEGRVLFVRHAIPGERVRVRVTEGGDGDRFLRADAVEVLSASPDRVPPPCPYAAPGRCGGCDFQHVGLERQRRLKEEVVREQFTRLARSPLPESFRVEPVAGDRDGLRWRTRVEFAVSPHGGVGLRAHRSHEVVPVERCLIAVDAVNTAVDAAVDALHAAVADADAENHATGEVRAGTEAATVDVRAIDSAATADERALDIVAPGSGGVVVVPVPVPPEADVPEVVEPVVGGRDHGTFVVSARGFWQVHPGAAATFLEAALDLLDLRPGETVLDLYSGVGLFSRGLAEGVGPSGRVVAVEADATATGQAQRNLAAYPWVVPVRARVDDFFGVARPKRKGPGRRRTSRPATRHPLAPPRADVVLLDPPRTGAGRDVVGAVTALGPRAVVHVACDPAALARDSADLADRGYRLVTLRAFDAFPMTHHVECLALFEPHPR